MQLNRSSARKRRLHQSDRLSADQIFCCEVKTSGACLSCEQSQSTNVTRTLSTPLLLWAGGALEDDGWCSVVPFATTAAPLLGRYSSTAVRRRQAFSCVNQSVRCNSLQGRLHFSK